MRLVRPILGSVAYALLGLVLSNCELSKVLSTPAPRKVVVSFENDSTLVLGLGFKPAVNVAIDGEMVIDPEIRYTSSDTTVIAVSARGDSLIARRLGAARITASLQGTLLPDPRPSATDTIYVIPKEFIITPSVIAFTSLGDSVTVTAAALDANNQAIPNIPITWASSDPDAVSVSPFGVVVAKRNTTAPVTISASLAGVTVPVPVTVAQQLDHFVFTPARYTLEAIGASVTIGVGGKDRRGNPIGSLTGLQFQAGNAAVLSVTSGGVVTSLDNGLSFVRVTSGLVSDTVDVDVEQVATNMTIVAPNGLAIRSVGATLRLIARAFDSRNAEVRQKKTSWISLNGNVARVDTSGMVEALGIGSAGIVARVDAAAETVTVVITDEPADVTISPSEASVTSVGATLQLAASVRNAIGSTIALAPVSWSALDPSIATVSSSGLVSTSSVGVARIVAASGSVSDTSLVTITNVPDQVNIVPTTITLASVNDQYVPELVVTNANGVPLDRSTLLWSSDDPLVARVTLAGTIIATGAGTTFIKAISPGNAARRDSMVVTVTNAPYTIVMSDDRDTLTAVGRTRIYSADVRNQAGALLVGYPVEFLSTRPSVASVGASTGLVTANGIGVTSIIARAGTTSATLELTVTNDAISIDLQPPALPITSIGDVAQLVATARNDLGIVVPASTLVWTSTIPSIASVDGTGRVTGLALGSTRVIATSGTLSDTSIVTVTNNPATISIEPDAVTLVYLGETVTPPATLANGLGAALPRTAATWSSDDPTIARVSSDGVITARGAGTTVVRATSGSVTDAVTVVVTNDPSSLLLNSERDTLTALGQQITYSAVVLNQAGAPIDAPVVTWTSTDASVGTVSGSSSEGVVTATYFGALPRTTLIIARSGTKADTVQLVVANPSRLYVDNSVFVSPRTGTASRPYAKIQDAVNAADAFDTVIVRKGGSAYSETVALSRRIVLLGDSTGFDRSNPNPLVLPLISHDTGTAAIAAITGSAQVIRFFRIRHTTDGASIDAHGPDIRIGYVYVNEGEVTREGRGIQVDNSSTGAFASVEHSRISAVRAYGVRFVGVTNGVIRDANVTAVDSIPGSTGAGIEANASNGILIDGDTVRLAGGAQVHLQSLSSATVSHLSLAGRHQLLRVRGASGNTQIFANTFDLQLRSDETFSTGSAADGRSGVHVHASEGVVLRDNLFVDATAGVMDGLRITESRGSGVLSSSAFGVSLLRNRFIGGRYSVRSSLSSWLSEGTRSTGAAKGIVGENADTASLFADTISNATSGCIDVAGARSNLSVRGGTFELCAGAPSTTMQAAVRATGTGTVLSVDSSSFRGPNTIAIEHDGGGTLAVTRNVMLANGTRSLALTGTHSVIGSTGASSITVTSNRVRGYSDLAALHVPSLASATVTSNHFTRNRVGVRVMSTATVNASGNDWFANDSAGVAYAGATASLDNNFWGDERGPKRAASLAATGDSALGLPSPSSFRNTPVFAGTGATELVLVRGQTGTGTLQNATVRAVDANGFPVQGVAVTFSCQPNCGTGNVIRLNGSIGDKVVTTLASGLAEVIVDLRSVPRSAIITATASGLPSISVTVNGQ